MSKTRISKSNREKVKNILNYSHSGGYLKKLPEIKEWRFSFTAIQVAICLLIIFLSMLWDKLQPQFPVPDPVVFLACIVAFGISCIIKKITLRRELQRVMIARGIPLDKKNIKHLGLTFILSATAADGHGYFSSDFVYGDAFKTSLVENGKQNIKEGCLLIFSDPKGELREPIENALSSAGYNVFHERPIVEGGNAGNAEK
jgi:hypothetical protein